MILYGCIIKPEKVVKLLGITINENLYISIHTEEICKKAGRQLSALRRLSFYLNSKAKLLLSERSSATFNTAQPSGITVVLQMPAQPSGITVVLQMLDVWTRFRSGL